MGDFPRIDGHCAIIGRNGSGKTQCGAWLLSHSDFHVRPHIIFDYKGDELLNDIRNIEEIDIRKAPPRKPGIYIVHPLPGEIDQEKVEAFLWKMWHQENIAGYIDEGYMIDPYSDAYSSIHTSGRSRKVSMWTLTQRPSKVNRFVFSESNHIGLFHLSDKRDYKIVEGFFPGSLHERLPEYTSRWYDVKGNKTFHLQPVPDRDSILSRFNDRLKPKRSFF